MKKFKVYFELFGKKMVTTIDAKTESEAKQAIAKKIIFHKIENVDPLDFGVDFLNDFFKGFKK